jgi:hypothetical protein
LSTTLAAGPVKSNGAGAFISSQAIALGGAEVSGTLAVGNGGTGVSFTSGGLLRGNNVERYQWLLLQILLLLWGNVCYKRN